MARYASISSLLVIPAAVLMGIAAFLLWVTGVVLWVVGRRRPSPRPPSIPPAQRVVHGTDGRIGPGAWKE
jgi:hypothetical protein